MINNLSNTVVSSRVRLARNFDGLPFPGKLSRYDAYNIVMRYAKIACDKVENNKFYGINSLSNLEIEALTEARLISSGLAERKEIGGVLISSDERFGVMLNEEDHIRAQCILRGFELDKAYDRVDRYDDSLLHTYTLAFDEKLGFLTACPTNLGTGLRASVMMFLPAVTENCEIERIIEQAKRNDITVRGAYGEGTKSYGYMYQISNCASLGLSEREIIESVKAFVIQIADIENKARLKYLDEEGINFVDKAYRAYGILSNARILPNKEFIELVSILKLAIALKIISFDSDRLDELVVNSQPANLSKLYKRNLTLSEQNEMRAKLARNTLSS